MLGTIRNVTAAALLVVIAAAPLAVAQSRRDTQADDVLERAQKAQPGRENERRSGVAGSGAMDPGSGTQGAGTPTGPDGGGLTGNEGQPEQQNAPRYPGGAVR